MTPDLSRKIALDLSFSDIKNLCKGNKNIITWVYDNPSFWYNKLKKEYNELQNSEIERGKNKYGSYKSFYKVLDSRTPLNIIFKYKYGIDEERENIIIKKKHLIVGLDRNQISKILSKTFNDLENEYNLDGSYKIYVNGKIYSYIENEINKNCFLGIKIGKENKIDIIFISETEDSIDSDDFFQSLSEGLKSQSVI